MTMNIAAFQEEEKKKIKWFLWMGTRTRTIRWMEQTLTLTMKARLVQE